MEIIESNFSDQKAKHIILDLRDNPGGFLPEATNILCQIFEEKDKLLLYTEGRANKKNEYKTTGKRFFPIEQVVVLIDEIQHRRVRSLLERFRIGTEESS
jgi:carboxyl-terminal processing protease